MCGVFCGQPVFRGDIGTRHLHHSRQTAEAATTDGFQTELWLSPDRRIQVHCTNRAVMLVHVLVLSRLDYGNSVLARVPKSTTVPLQRVQNAAGHLIVGLRACDYASTALAAGTPAHPTQTVHHDAFCSSQNVPGVPRRHSFHHHWQPDTTWSALCRQHVVSATEMSYVHGRACILLLWPTRVERSAFNPPWHCWPHTFQKTSQNTLL